jgi:hypothetical protein
MICCSGVECSRQADHDTAAARRKMKNAEACITRSHQEGKAAEDLENRLRHLVSGHDEAIQQKPHQRGLWQVARHEGIGKHSLDWHGRFRANFAERTEC